MSTEVENIQALSHAVMTEAKSQAEQSVTEARKKAEAIRAEAEKQAAAERQRILDNANKEAGRLRSQAIASANLKARNLQLEQREKLLNSVFDGVTRHLPDVQNNGNYAGIALNLVKEAVNLLGSDSAVIQADAKTRAVLTSDVLAQLSAETGVKLQMGEPLGHGMGVIVQNPDGHRRYDNTLETRLKRMQDSLRNPVYHLLMGETL